MQSSVRLYLAGPAGSGKTEIAKVLEVRHGFRRVSLGGTCRRVAAGFGLRGDRTGLQAVGDILRHFSGPAAIAVMAAKRAREIVGPVVVDGVRLVAEAEYLRADGWIGVRMEAPADVRAARLDARDGSSEVPDHETEREAGTVPADMVLSVVAPESLEQAVDHMLDRLSLTT